MFSRFELQFSGKLQKRHHKPNQHRLAKMSKTLSSKRVYDSDDGFVEDAPKTKKQKSEPKQRNTKMQKDDDGNEYWEVSMARVVRLELTALT